MSALSPAEAIRVLREALAEIARHPHNMYLGDPTTDYSIGITDGHRCAATIARDALAATADVREESANAEVITVLRRARTVVYESRDERGDHDCSECYVHVECPLLGDIDKAIARAEAGGEKP